MRTDLSTIHKVVNGILLLSLAALVIAAAVVLTGRGDAKDFLPLVFAGMGVLGGLLAKTSTQSEPPTTADKPGLSADKLGSDTSERCLLPEAKEETALSTETTQEIPAHSEEATP